MNKTKNGRLILASGSPRRKEILEKFGYSPIIKISGFDEAVVQEKNPKKLVMLLSKGKAENVRKICEPGDTILAADTIVVVDDEVLGKPKTKKEAFEMLSKIRGRKHLVYSGVTIIKCHKKPEDDEIINFADKTEVRLFDIDVLTNCRIRKFIDSGVPMDKAGAYAIQGEFGRYIEGINGDIYNVIGLPIKALNYL